MPTMIAVGVARPSAQGQATISTVTALISANVSAGAGPNAHHSASVSSATPITTGTKTAATRSTSAWIGAFEPCACSTSAMILDSADSAPRAVARTRSAPVVFCVAP